MLSEIVNIVQDTPGLTKRWFMDDVLDLLCWIEDEELIAFQLSYDTHSDPKALTWQKEQGFSHDRIDAGEHRPGRYKASPILIAEENTDISNLVARFEKRSAQIEAGIYRDVMAILQRFPSA